MIFAKFYPPRCKPKDPKFDRRDVYIITQSALWLTGPISNTSASLQPERSEGYAVLQEMLRGMTGGAGEKRFTPCARPGRGSRWTRYHAERGARIEARRRSGRGFIPKKEIHTPTVDESQRSLHRRPCGMPPAAGNSGQLKPVAGDVREDQALTGKVSVSGQVAVMRINGLLTKIIFDANPESEILRRGKLSAGLDVSV